MISAAIVISFATAQVYAHPDSAKRKSLPWRRQ
jgi:hypothetical protein